jgi:hypothetical protein
MREEVLTLPKGVFLTREDLLGTLNDRIQMRGERNGSIYRFHIHRDMLQIHATHRQPIGSTLQVTALCSGIGLFDPKEMPLRTNAYITFDFVYKTILD